MRTEIGIYFQRLLLCSTSFGRNVSHRNQRFQKYLMKIENIGTRHRDVVERPNGRERTCTPRNVHMVLSDFDGVVQSYDYPSVMDVHAQIARFMRPTWGAPGSCRPLMGPRLAPWTLLSGCKPEGYGGNRVSPKHNKIQRNTNGLHKLWDILYMWLPWKLALIASHQLLKRTCVTLHNFPWGLFTPTYWY